MSFKDELACRSEAFNGYLEEALSGPFDCPDILADAVRYSALAGGKRIRPVLTLEVTKIFGGNQKEVLPLALALEMIHTYSLIHDDLPEMDDDDLRRGKPTNHVVFGQAQAVLAGDALLNLAVETVLSGIPKEEENYLEAARILFHASGINGMIGGQSMDIEGGRDLNYINSHKTGALLTAAVLCGAVATLGAEAMEIEPLKRYAEAVGEAFQLVDDVLDVEGSTEELGKETGSDEKNDKITSVSLYGLDETKNRIKELQKQAHLALDTINYDTKFLADLADYICERNS